MKAFLCTLLLFVSVTAFAQDSSRFLSKGQLYGQVFGDYFYKAHADSLKRGYYQYSRLPQNSNAFQIRRVYLGYKYDFNSRFSANILLESAWNSNDFSLFIKYANLRWKNIFRGSDVIIGRMKTPTFSTLTDKIWSYRAVERTIADMHGNPSYDLGAALRGHFDEADRFGYTLMVGNGSGSEVVDDRFKKFYGEVYAKAAGGRLVFDLYADYERLHWQPGFHQSTNMFKAFIAYQSPVFTAGVEAYTQYLRDGVAQNKAGARDTIGIQNFGLSVFVHGKLLENQLGYFVRVDHFNPYMDFESGTTGLNSLLPEYDAANRSRFITAGLDYEPVGKVHFIPNIWYCRYKKLADGQPKGYDLVYRLTFYYKFES